MMKQFFWGPQRQAVEFTPGDTILEALLREKIEIDHSCGGGASCGTCRVFVQALGANSALPAPECLEQEFRTDRGFEPNERLSCQLSAAAGIWVISPAPKRD